MSNGLTYNGPINPNPAPGESRIIIYTYVPSMALGVIGVITFAAILGINIWYLFKRNKNGGSNSAVTYRSFHILMIVGSAMEAVGYGIRIASNKRPFVVVYFVVQYFMIVVAPVLFSAAIYLSLTLLVKGFPNTERLLVISPRLILAFFITADAVCTIIQVAGAALIGVSQSAAVSGTPSKVTPKQANDILLAGLVCQCFSFLNFLIVLSFAIYRALQPSFADTLPASTYRKMKMMFWVILVTAILIFARTLFRMAETAEGFFGKAATMESLFGVFEFAPVIIALIIWAIFPPRKFLDRADSGTINGQASSSKERAGLTERSDSA